jgi:hypothetical protein
MRTVVRASANGAVRSPKFLCSACGVHLKPAFSLRMLLAIPVAVLTFAVAYYSITLLKSSGLLGGTWMAAVIGGAVGLAFAIPAKVVVLGIAYRVSDEVAHEQK